MFHSLFQLEQSGRLQRQVARDYLTPRNEDITVLKGHKLSITCLVISPDNKHVFSGSKDCSIIKCKRSAPYLEIVVYKFWKLSFTIKHKSVIQISYLITYLSDIFRTVLKMWNCSSMCYVILQTYFHKTGGCFFPHAIAKLHAFALSESC